MKFVKVSSSSVVPLFLLALLGAPACVWSYEQVATLYETNGDTHTYRNHIPDSTYLENSVEKICILGIWSFYSKVAFATLEYGRYTPEGLTYCFNNTRSIRSLRFGGAKDTTEASVSFYSGENYQGDEILVTTQALANIKAGSYVATGTKSWTIFEGSNFDGHYKCVAPASPTFIDFHGNLDEFSNYGSVTQGCLEPASGIRRPNTTNSTLTTTD